jgi:predicted deacylase
VAQSGKETRYVSAVGPAGEEIRVPLATVHGADDGPTLAVVAGIHGSEYDGIEATRRLYRAVEPRDLRGTLITIPCLNLPAFYGLAMHVNPIDNENPARALPGDPNGSNTQRMVDLAWTHAIKAADYVIDVHGGDLEEELVEYSQVELVGDPDVDGRGEALARALDMPFFVKRVARQSAVDAPGPIGLVAARHRIPAVLCEAGSHGFLDERCIAAHGKALRNALRHLSMLDGDLERENPNPIEMDGFAGYAAPSDGFWYPEVEKGDVIEPGQRLGTMQDVFGEQTETIEATQRAAILGVMTIPARRKGDMLMGVGTLA